MKNFKVIESNTHNNDRRNVFFKSTILKSNVTGERYKLCYDVRNGATKSKGTIYVYNKDWNYLVNNTELGIHEFPSYVGSEREHVAMQTTWEKKCITFLDNFEK